MQLLLLSFSRDKSQRLGRYPSTLRPKDKQLTFIFTWSSKLHSLQEMSSESASQITSADGAPQEYSVSECCPTTTLPPQRILSSRRPVLDFSWRTLASMPGTNQVSLCVSPQVVVTVLMSELCWRIPLALILLMRSFCRPRAIPSRTLVVMDLLRLCPKVVRLLMPRILLLMTLMVLSVMFNQDLQWPPPITLCYQRSGTIRKMIPGRRTTRLCSVIILKSIIRFNSNLLSKPTFWTPWDPWKTDSAYSPWVRTMSSWTMPGRSAASPNHPWKPFANLDFHWKRALDEAGIDNFRFHDLRHTAASYLTQAGIPAITVAAILGHKTLQMTKRYSHLAVEHQRDAVMKVFGRH